MNTLERLLYACVVEKEKIRKRHNLDPWTEKQVSKYKYANRSKLEKAATLCEELDMDPAHMVEVCFKYAVGRLRHADGPMLTMLGSKVFVLKSFADFHEIPLEKAEVMAHKEEIYNRLIANLTTQAANVSARFSQLGENGLYSATESALAIYYASQFLKTPKDAELRAEAIKEVQGSAALKAAIRERFSWLYEDLIGEEEDE